MAGIGREFLLFLPVHAGEGLQPVFEGFQLRLSGNHRGSICVRIHIVMNLRMKPRSLCIWCAVALQLALAAAFVLWAPQAAGAQDLSEYLEGLSPAQVTSFMEVAQKVQCGCGCGRGSLMTCRLTDPNCPTSPRLLKTAASLIKAGQNTTSVISSISNVGNPAPAAATPPPPTVDANPIALEVGVSPSKGAKDAKVTIIEFSDFQ